MQLVNKAEKGDGLDRVSIRGFDSYKDALTFVKQGFQSDGLNPTVKGTVVYGEPPLPIPGYPYIVFYDFADGEVRLLSITQTYADLPELAIRSWGAQFLLTRLD